MNRSHRRYAIAARLLTLLCLTGIASCKNDSATTAPTPGPPMKGVPGHPDAQGSDSAMFRAIDKAMAKKQQQSQQPQQPQGSQ